MRGYEGWAVDMRAIHMILSLSLGQMGVGPLWFRTLVGMR